MFFVFHDPSTTDIYTLSLHDALPIYFETSVVPGSFFEDPNRFRMGVGIPTESVQAALPQLERGLERDRKSTRLNSSHVRISYAVFCLKKKKLQAARL